MPKRTLGEVLDEFPAYKLQGALSVVTLLSAHMGKEDRKGKKVFSLPMEFFTANNIHPRQVSEALEVFKNVHKNTHGDPVLDGGISSQPLPPPGIKIENREEIVVGIAWIPFSKIEHELLKRVGYFSSGDKIDIGYSLRDGIYAVGSKLRPYEASKQKIKIIKLIHSGEAARLKEITKNGNISNEANASRDIREINDDFIKKLKLQHELILHNPAVGYHLNTVIYNISGH